MRLYNTHNTESDQIRTVKIVSQKDLIQNKYCILPAGTTMNF